MAANGGSDGSVQSETTIYSSGNNSGSPDLRFLHYNDVYHVEPGSREPVGGIARFQTLCQSYRSSNPKYAGQSELITFFSGDAFNPSLESSVTKGKHMLAPLNDLHTDVACLGNHDLDFGVEQFQYLAKRCKFPWLCANVLDPALGEDIPLGNCRRSVMLESSNGIKIGVIGVVEREWLDTINTLPPSLKYLSASATVAELAPLLRQEGAEMIVVVSHQRQPNDDKLAMKLEPGVVDIILGGHDHTFAYSFINGIHLLRSGTDFKQLSYIEARRSNTNSRLWDFEIIRRDVVSSIPEDPAAVAMVENITAKLRPMLEKPIGYTSAPLDARFSTVRNKESNLGNFVCDLMRFHYNTDCCIMASGTIRGDQIYPPGVLRVRDIMFCFPFEDPCVVVALKGKHIVAALENAVGKHPALEGRFPQVSNIEFTFDPAKPEGSRCSSVCIGEAPVDLEKEYTLVTRDYMTRGKDGFRSLMLEEDGGPARSIVSDENGGLLSMIIRQYFMSLKVMGKWKRLGDTMGKHFEHVQEGLHKVHPVLNASPAEAPGFRSGMTQSTVDVSAEEQKEANGDVRESLVGRAQQQQHRRQVSEVTQRPAKSRKLTREESSQAADLSDSEDDDDELAEDPAQERELAIKRKVMRKWWRLAGLPGNPRMVEQKGDEFAVAWTKGIAPRLEGRIKIIGVEA